MFSDICLWFVFNMRNDFFYPNEKSCFKDQWTYIMFPAFSLLRRELNISEDKQDRVTVERYREKCVYLCNRVSLQCTRQLK